MICLGLCLAPNPAYTEYRTTFPNPASPAWVNTTTAPRGVPCCIITLTPGGEKMNACVPIRWVFCISISFVLGWIDSTPAQSLPGVVTTCTDLEGNTYSISGRVTHDKGMGWKPDSFRNSSVLLFATPEGFDLFIKDERLDGKPYSPVKVDNGVMRNHPETEFGGRKGVLLSIDYYRPDSVTIETYQFDLDAKGNGSLLLTRHRRNWYIAYATIMLGTCVGQSGDLDSRSRSTSPHGNRTPDGGWDFTPEIP